MNAPAVLATVVLCVCFAGVVAAGAAPSASPEIVELYPNPIAPDDAGEFVTVRVPAGVNLSEYELADEHDSVRLSRPAGGSRAGPSLVTFSTDVNRTSVLTDRTVAPLPDRLQLANSGESIRLVRNGTVVDEVTYEDAPDASVYDAEAGTWSPIGRTDRPVVTHVGGSVETFVLPDEPERAVAFLENATERVLLAGYTFSSDAAVDALVDAHERGVSVEVLVEGDPVGGMTAAGVEALDELVRAGIPVRVFAGEPSRYRYHHAKYAIVDGRALVTTENWKPSGTGGGSSRGWGVITGQDRIVEGLVETYRADAGWVDTVPWEEHDVAPVEDDGPQGSYPSSFEATTLPVDRTHLLVAPDNVEGRLLETIEGARESILVKQVGIGDRDLPFLAAVLDAAERGVDVRILLSGAWYAEEENRRVKRWLDEQAEAADLPLSVRVAEPGGDFEKIHAKGMVVDGEHTFLGSVNWNNNSVQENREVGLLLESEAVGGYFERVFESDWETGPDRGIPLGYLAACLVAAAGAIAVGRRLRFEE